MRIWFSFPFSHGQAYATWERRRGGAWHRDTVCLCVTVCDWVWEWGDCKLNSGLSEGDRNVWWNHFFWVSGNVYECVCENKICNFTLMCRRIEWRTGARDTVVSLIETVFVCVWGRIFWFINFRRSSLPCFHPDTAVVITFSETLRPLMPFFFFFITILLYSVSLFITFSIAVSYLPLWSQTFHSLSPLLSSLHLPLSDVLCFLALHCVPLNFSLCISQHSAFTVSPPFIH